MYNNIIGGAQDKENNKTDTKNIQLRVLHENKDAFDGKLEFEIMLLPYEGDDSWVSPVIKEIKQMLDSEQLPDPGENCEYCDYRKLISQVE